MQSNETTTSAMGGGGGEGEGCRGGESSRKCGVLKKNTYIHNSLHPSTGARKYFNEYRTLAFMESVDSSWEEALFAFGLPSLISTNIY